MRIPLADGNPDSRVYAYEVVVVGDEGMPKLYKAVYAAGGECLQCHVMDGSTIFRSENQRRIKLLHLESVAPG